MFVCYLQTVPGGRQQVQRGAGHGGGLAHRAPARARLLFGEFTSLQYDIC